MSDYVLLVASLPWSGAGNNCPGGCAVLLQAGPGWGELDREQGVLKWPRAGACPACQARTLATLGVTSCEPWQGPQRSPPWAHLSPAAAHSNLHWGPVAQDSYPQEQVIPGTPKRPGKENVPLPQFLNNFTSQRFVSASFTTQPRITTAARFGEGTWDDLQTPSQLSVWF